MRNKNAILERILDHIVLILHNMLSQSYIFCVSIFNLIFLAKIYKCQLCYFFKYNMIKKLTLSEGESSTFWTSYHFLRNVFWIFSHETIFTSFVVQINKVVLFRLNCFCTFHQNSEPANCHYSPNHNMFIYTSKKRLSLLAHHLGVYTRFNLLGRLLANI